MNKGKTPPVPASELARVLTGTHCPFPHPPSATFLLISYHILSPGHFSDKLSSPRQPPVPRGCAIFDSASRGLDAHAGSQRDQNDDEDREGPYVGRDHGWVLQRAPSQESYEDAIQPWHPHQQKDVVAREQSIATLECDESRGQVSQFCTLFLCPALNFVAQKRLAQVHNVLSRTSLPSSSSHPELSDGMGDDGNAATSEVVQKALIRSGPADRPGRAKEQTKFSSGQSPSAEEYILSSTIYKVHRTDSQESSSVSMATLAGLGKGGGDVRSAAGQYRWQVSLPACESASLRASGLASQSMFVCGVCLHLLHARIQLSLCSLNIQIPELRPDDATSMVFGQR
jgi:hypothetical protein